MDVTRMIASRIFPCYLYLNYITETHNEGKIYNVRHQIEKSPIGHLHLFFCVSIKNRNDADFFKTRDVLGNISGNWMLYD